MSRTKEVRISTIKTNHFVRKELNQDRVLFFAELLEEGEDLGAIEITTDHEMIDGRHRLEAHLLCDKEVIHAKDSEISGEAELIEKAFRANSGGALPPTRQDIEHTVGLLLDCNESMKSIAERLGLPAKLSRDLARDVKSKRQRVILQKAINSVAEGGMTVAKASEVHKVDLGKLKEALSGKKHKPEFGVSTIKATSTRMYKSASSKIASTMRKLIDQYEDGDMTEGEVL